ncbi:MAG TPA: hypothetical protein GX728_00055 [Clostridiaceae bacterium]|nr:hypothetical protein [Clostridiaceae bacterium]
MEIKYLLKFTSKHEHAKDLIDGRLFMNQAAFYHDRGEGQGDIREGAFTHTSMAYWGSSRPIYCMYAAYENQLVDNIVVVPHKLVTDFQSEYVVVVNYEEFIQMLENKELRTKYALTFGIVNYHNMETEDSHRILEGKVEPLLIKHPFYRYQQEFRIIVHENLEDITEKGIVDGMEVDCIVGRKPKTYLLKRDLGRIAKIIRLDDCHIIGEKLFINLNSEEKSSPQLVIN